MTKIVNEESFTIGRSVDCAISLTEDSISRVHLTVYRRQDQVWIEDKGSSNGTFVNGARIANNTLVNVMPADKIRIGKSDYVVSLNLDLKDEEVSDVMRADATDFMQHPLVAEKLVARKIEKPDIEKKIEQQNFEKSGVLKAPQKITPVEAPLADKTSMPIEKNLSELLVPKIDFKIPQPVRAASAAAVPVIDDAQKAAENARMVSLKNEAERLVHEAHKKSAQIIYQGEIQAEKRVQAIYTQAQDRQTEADVYYQEKISAAHKEADAVIINFQSMGQELITQARHMAQELRDEVDLYVDNMREKTRREVDHIISNARHEAETVKKEAFEKAITKAEIEAADHVASAKAEAADLLGFAKMQAEELLEKSRVEIEKDLKELRSQLDLKQRQVADLKREEEELEIRGRGELEEHESRMAGLDSTFQALQSELLVAQKDLANMRAQESAALEETKRLEAASTEEIKRQEALGEELKKVNQGLLQERSVLESKLKDLQGQMGHFSLDIQATEEKRRQMEQDILQQKAQLKDRLERDRAQIIKDSEERVHEAQMDMGKRLQKLERELFDEIVSRKDKLVKEIIVIVETRIAKVLEPAKWDQVSSVIFDGVQAAIEGRAVSFTDVGAKPKHSQSLERKKKKEHMRWLATGLVCGLALTFASLKVQSIMNQDKNPMRTIANEDARKRQEELDKRKFNPVQTKELKDTYTDSVIYTEGFVEGFQQAEFQKNLYKAASAYLLKTWRVDEDKSIQVLSMSSALVKELNDKRQAIHPDFVKDGIQKMHALEKQSMDRMKAVLGSEVRVESYRRFERKFYETEILKR